MSRKHLLILFLDGVGMGPNDPATNPFVTARMPRLAALLGDGWYLDRTAPIFAPHATLVPTDANLGVEGRPQSATGQAAIMTGRNIPALIGGHWGPWPGESIQKYLREGTVFSAVVAANKRAALLNPYPPEYHAAVRNGRRMYSSITLSANLAGVRFRTPDDLRAGYAVSPNFTNESWRTRLKLPDIPAVTLPEAGRRLAQLARQHHFSFFDHWPTDFVGHQDTLPQAVAHLERLDVVIGAVTDAWDSTDGLLLITSDHGNIEAKDARTHTRNPVPTILYGAGHRRWAAEIHDLTHIAGVVRGFLEL